MTSGYRLCLVYNLVLKRTVTDVPSAQKVESTNHELLKLVRRMPTASDPVWGYLLDHKYTQKNLYFRNLKGRDQETVSLLKDAVDENGEKLFLSHKTIDGYRTKAMKKIGVNNTAGIIQGNRRNLNIPTSGDI